MDAGLALKEYLEFVVGRLVKRPEQAGVVHDQDERGHVFLIRAAPEDMGVLIGRSGQTIGAIRGLLEAAAEKHGLRVKLKVEEG